MPTAYTDQLQKQKYNVKKWLKETIVRGLGVCMNLRDESLDLGESEIKQKLKDSAKQKDSYYPSSLEKTKENLKLFENASIKKLQAEFKKDKEKEIRIYETKTKKHNLEKKKHQDSLMEVMRLEAIADLQSLPEDSVTKGALKFAREQILSTLDFDYKGEAYRQPILDQTFEQWFDSNKKRLEWEIEYYTGKVAEEAARTDERYEEYKKFVEFVNENSLN